MRTRASHKYAAPRHKQAPSDFLLYAVHPSTDSPSVHVAHCDHRLLTPSPPSRGKVWWCKSLVHLNDSPSLALCRAQGCSAGLSSAAQPSPCSGIFLPQDLEAAARKSRWTAMVTKVPLVAAGGSPGETQAPWQGEEGPGGDRNGESRAVSGSCTHRFSCCPHLVPGCCYWASSRLVQQAGERKQSRRAAVMTSPTGMP